jgi:hypothetical protein
MGRECKHVWMLLDKRHVVNTEKIIYFFACSKCLKFRKLSNEEL